MFSNRFNICTKNIFLPFQSIIQEDKLLTRLETLENHLDIVTKVRGNERKLGRGVIEKHVFNYIGL